MNSLVFLEPNKIDAEPFTTSKIIAKHAGVQHHTTTRILRKYAEDFDAFGILGFNIQESSKPGQPEKHYKLNEQQATLLITYLKNTAQVRAFKKELVRQFYAMRAELNRRHMERTALKPIRRQMTDVIQQVTENKWAYKIYTDLSYILTVGQIAAKIRQARGARKTAAAIDYMTADEIHAVTEMTFRIGVLLEIGMDYATIKASLQNRLMSKAG